MFWGYPSDRGPGCTVTQVRGTARFTDCDGRELDVAELARPEGVFPTVVDSRSLEIDLRAVTTPGSWSPAPTTTG